MARLDKARTRVLCDDYGLCGTVLAEIAEQAGIGRVLFLPWGWRKDADGLWRYSARRAARTPPKRVIRAAIDSSRAIDGEALGVAFWIRS